MIIGPLVPERALARIALLAVSLMLVASPALAESKPAHAVPRSLAGKKVACVLKVQEVGVKSGKDLNAELCRSLGAAGLQVVKDQDSAELLVTGSIVLRPDAKSVVSGRGVATLKAHDDGMTMGSAMAHLENHDAAALGAALVKTLSEQVVSSIIQQ